MNGAQHIFDSAHYQELRRHIVRRAMQPFFRARKRRSKIVCDLHGADIRTILICRPNHRLGNLLLLTPLVVELQRIFPEAEIDIVLAGRDGAELFESFPGVARIYSLSRRMVRHPVATIRTALQIRRARYDLVIDPCEASQSGRLLTAIAGARYVIGNPRDPRAADPEEAAAMRRAPRHMAQWPVYLIRRAATRHPPEPGRAFPPLDIRLSADERQIARRELDLLLETAGKSGVETIVGVFADATGAKCHDKDWWRRFIREMEAQHPDCAIVEIAPPDGRTRLSMNLPSFSSPSPRKIAALISNMTCFVSADCGVMHLASASGVPTIGLFSVTDASKYAPYGRGSRALVTNGKSPEEIALLASELLEKYRKHQNGKARA